MSILITGGTKGIGRAIALAFAEPGVDVFLNHAGDDAAAREARSLVEATGARCHVIKQDVGTPEGARAVLDQGCGDASIRLDQLVHCAVRAIPKRALDCDAHDFTAAVNLNGTALLYLVQAADPTARSRQHGVLPHQPGRTHRRAQLRRHRCRQGARGVLWCAISRASSRRAACASTALPPAWCTPMRSGRSSATRQNEIVKHAADSNPSGRGVQDEDYTSVIRFLASPEAAFVQGQTIFVNGGHYLAA